MNRAVTIFAHIVRAFHLSYGKKWSFLSTFGIVFLVSLIALSRNGLLPEAQKDSEAKEVSSFGTTVTHAESVSIENTAGVAAAASAPVLVTENKLPKGSAITKTALANAELPVSIEIPSIGLSQKVSEPSSTNIEVMDKELLSGAVHFPTSASLGEDGNVIIFGHSSYLPIVHNSAYKAFNDIQKLVPGQQIMVRSKDKEYIYIVASVEKESADSNTGIPLQVASPRLTLATCDSFGKKTDRFVVTAVLVESRALSS